MNDAEQYASIQFSDPIAVGQELTGLITISNQAGYNLQHQWQRSKIIYRR